MGDAIRLEGLSKSYGSVLAVDRLTLSVSRGEVFGFLGPNGAGKTTTIRLLLDLLRPTAGRAEVLGLDPRRDGVELRRLVGYLPGDVELYGNVTGRQLLGFYASLRRAVEAADIDRLVARFEVELDRPVRTLSRGNKQKLAIVQAFMHRPQLLVMDEPTSGLDPLVQEVFHQHLQETVTAGGTVFLSSHILSEVQQVADRVAIIRSGQLVATEPVERLQSAARRVEVRFPAEVEIGAAALSVPGVRGLEIEQLGAVGGAGGAVVARCWVEGAMDAFVKAVARYPVLSLTSREPDLEDVFLTYYREQEPQG